ncbi:hypothetical protein D4764_13G0000350 [Takifugu flavidus]|uniref:Uncharacterized protein n=1 Tax=Takifugu flavidus TaxID=433684 RepID=A0A5C6P7D1_9TELE|nr:hypothetical protein D4764_13G0000350 [Takifugu flavidus]
MAAPQFAIIRAIGLQMSLDCLEKRFWAITKQARRGEERRGEERRGEEREERRGEERRGTEHRNTYKNTLYAGRVGVQSRRSSHSSCTCK